MVSMITYPHPLDYATGIKYAITEKKLPIEYSPSAESFIVEEIIDFEKMGFNNEKGEYAVLRVTKRNIDTLKAVEVVSRKLGLPSSNILFFGVKDKSATTISHFFIKSHLLDKSTLPIEYKGLRVELLGFTRRKPVKGFFLGNKFRVLIRNASASIRGELREIINLINSIGLPSYYGYQRFGVKRYNTHILGKYILLGREDLLSSTLLSTIYPREEVEVVVKRLQRNYRDLLYEYQYASSSIDSGVEKLVRVTRGLLIDAYASYLYNLALNKIIESTGFSGLSNEIPMPGCPGSITLYSEVFKSEGVGIANSSKLPCFYRIGYFIPRGNNLLCSDHDLIYEFELNPGFYASIVLREVFKENLVFRD